MRNFLLVALAGSVFAASACDGDPASDGQDGGAGGEVPATGGSVASGGSNTGGSATGGSPSGGMGGLGGLGGMGGALSLDEACAAWCSTIAVPDCADDPVEETCITNCQGEVTPGCEAEWSAWKSCEAALTFECFPFAGEERAVKSDPSACVDEDDAYFNCFMSMAPE